MYPYLEVNAKGFYLFL